MANPVLALFTSLKLTIVCLAFAMVLIVVGTLAQVELGIYIAQQKFFDTFFVWHQFGVTGPRLPILPGGWLIGSVLVVNLLAAHLSRFTLGWGRLALALLFIIPQGWLVMHIGYSPMPLVLLFLANGAVGLWVTTRLHWQKLGITLTHFGVVILLLGGLFTALYSVESQMTIDTGQTVHFSESTRGIELAVIDHSPADKDNVVAIPQSILAQQGTVAHPQLPFTIRVKKYMANSEMTQRKADDQGEPQATAGIGPRFKVEEAPIVTKMNARDIPAAIVEVMQGEKSLGTYMVSLWFKFVMPDSVQTVEVDGKKYDLAMRPERFYKPFSLTLLKFSHDKYTGTNIPKNFSSLVRLKDAKHSEDREILIYMNAPLRHGGETYYQADFRNDDRTTILQVVRNPNWIMPYIACTLVSLGLFVQFGAHLLRFIKRRATA